MAGRPRLGLHRAQPDAGAESRHGSFEWLANGRCAAADCKDSVGRKRPMFAQTIKKRLSSVLGFCSLRSPRQPQDTIDHRDKMLVGVPDEVDGGCTGIAIKRLLKAPFAPSQSSCERKDGRARCGFRGILSRKSPLRISQSRSVMFADRAHKIQGTSQSNQEDYESRVVYGDSEVTNIRETVSYSRVFSDREVTSDSDVASDSEAIAPVENCVKTSRVASTCESCGIGGSATQVSVTVPSHDREVHEESGVVLREKEAQEEPGVVPQERESPKERALVELTSRQSLFH